MPRRRNGWLPHYFLIPVVFGVGPLQTWIGWNYTATWPRKSMPHRQYDRLRIVCEAIGKKTEVSGDLPLTLISRECHVNRSRLVPGQQTPDHCDLARHQ